MEDILKGQRCLLTLLILAIFCTCGRAQMTDRELRGVWMATVLNIDYPQNPTPSATTLQADFKSQLYRLRQAGINAIFVQVRPAGDAIYPSQLAPWSKWLTGVQGKAPVSNFDPLAYMIKTAHAQGVELHAWVNPYRVAMTMDSLDKAPNHLLNTHPEWCRAYNGRRYLDPGLPRRRPALPRPRGLCQLRPQPTTSRLAPQQCEYLRCRNPPADQSS